MAMEDRAATSIQARFRGFRWRRKQRRDIKAVAKIQALQRGRFTRREFAKLRDFSREQENFQQATRRRQIRIWQNEQELYFLQHATAADLERVRAFQQQHSARLIQRSWRALNQSTAPSKKDKVDVVTPSDRVYTFDPFRLGTAGDKTACWLQWSRDMACTEPSKASPSLLLRKEELRASAFVGNLPTAIVNEETFASRRKEIQERIKRKAAQQKAKNNVAPKRRASVKSGAVEGANPVMNRRRELYEQVVAMKSATAQRVLQYQQNTRASRSDKERLSSQVVASCDNRLNHLRAESPEQMTPSEEGNQQAHDEAQEMEKWDTARRIRAWNHHRRAVRSVLDKRHWWQTQLAGEVRDIRRVVVAKSPWEDEHKIWVWPHCESNNQNENEADHNRTGPAQRSAWPSMEIQRFLVVDKGMEEPQNQSLSDDEASEWWRAHCTQSHLAINGALMIDKPYSAEFANNVTKEGDLFPVCTSEVVANRDLYKLQQRAKSAARTKSLEQDVGQRIKSLATQVGRHVHEMEAQVEDNTQLALEAVRRKEERRVRITREQKATMTIQRYARGMQGRKHAREVHAEYFVMVRGRAIRRGRCEECGDQRAVLECQQCEESLHFCPSCWVHVHSTRRRKTHVAIPMTTVVAPRPVQETENPKSSIVMKPNTDLPTTSVSKVAENTISPRLRALPSPKSNTTRQAEPVIKQKKFPANTKNSSTEQSKQDDIRSATPVRTITTQNDKSPGLTEVYALARRVRSEVQEASMSAEDEFAPVQKHGGVNSAEIIPVESSGDLLVQEDSANDEVDFSTVEGDGALGNEDEIDQHNLEEPQHVKGEPESSISDSIHSPKPEKSSNDYEISLESSPLDGVDNVDTATTELAVQEPEVENEAGPDTTHIVSVENTEASPTEENASANDSSASAIVVAARIADSSSSVTTLAENLQTTNQHGAVTTGEQIGQDAATAVAVISSEDAPAPS